MPEFGAGLLEGGRFSLGAEQCSEGRCAMEQLRMASTLGTDYLCVMRSDAHARALLCSCAGLDQREHMRRWDTGTANLVSCSRIQNFTQVVVLYDSMLGGHQNVLYLFWPRSE